MSKNNHSFTNSFYYDKFSQKRGELFDHVKKNPNDEAAKGKLEFINNFLQEGNESKWPAVWEEWEKNNFCWPIEKIIPERK